MTAGPHSDEFDQPAADLVAAVVEWYAANARELPWRRHDTGPWGVLVSEVMLQQTPVARVEPVWHAWMERWPSPGDLASDPAGAAVRAWGRLGYPRRALRLHACATEIVARHDGQVPTDVSRLQALPGVGAYTAAAVAAFAHRQRVAVLDTNVRRVLARVLVGVGQPASSGPSRAEHVLAAGLLPELPESAARWSVAVMELGALVCTARAPRCGLCPLAGSCAWLARGRPPLASPTPAQSYAGTDRQCRGRLLAVLRDSVEPVPSARLDDVWSDPVQRARALDGLVADGLVEPVGSGRFALPGEEAAPA